MASAVATRQAAGEEGMRHLGYPLYFLTIAGIAQLAGRRGDPADPLPDH